jgi:signal transduction histidine kinase
VDDIRRLADRAGDHVGVDLEVTGGVGDLPPAIDAAVYRLAQESITNALRHAKGATRVQIRVDASDGVLRLTVRDDGDTSGATGPIVAGYGLAGMAERARLLGGTCAGGPDPAGGWVVTAELPLPGPVGERTR